MSFHDPFSPGHEGEYSAPRGRMIGEPTHSSPIWMLTVADLFSLILAFFVLLYSMSDVRQGEWQEMKDSLRESMPQVDDQSAYHSPRKMLTIEQVNLSQARNLDYLSRVINDRFADLSKDKNIQITRQADRIIVSLRDQDMFAANDATLLPAASPALLKISEFLANLNNAISVEAYASDEAKSAKFPSDWELSLARANAVREVLRRAGYPYPIDAYGMGQPVMEGVSGNGFQPSQAAGRRIDIVVRENVAKF